jgi:hypothetical protein
MNHGLNYPIVTEKEGSVTFQKKKVSTKIGYIKEKKVFSQSYERGMVYDYQRNDIKSI